MVTVGAAAFVGLLLHLQVVFGSVADIAAVACVQSTVYGESRGESAVGKSLVRTVILKRSEESGRHPCYVVSLPKQFGGFRLSHLARAADWGRYDWALFTGPCGAATHFHAARETPRWARSPRMRRLCRVGGHVFYQELSR